MNYNQLINSVSFSSLKDSALYFDRVVPINPVEFVIWDEPPLSDTYSSQQFVIDRDRQLHNALIRNKKIINNLLFGANEKSELPDSAINILSSYTAVAQSYSRSKIPPLYVNAQYVSHVYLPLQEKALAESYINNDPTIVENISVRRVILDICETFNVINPSIVLPSGINFGENKDVHTESESIIASISGMGLIDAGSASWEQIMEVRSDPACHLSIRRFRKMIFDDYIGNDTSYIQDDINQKMFDYDRALVKHGLVKSDTLLSAIFTSPTVSGAATTILAAGSAALADRAFIISAGLASLPVSLAAIGEIAKVTFERRKANRDMEDYHFTHPLSYIFDARRIIER